MKFVVVAVIGVTAVFLLGVLAIDRDMIGQMILALIVSGLIAVAGGFIFVWLYGKYTKALNDSKAIEYDHIEKVIGMGLIPMSSRYRYEPLQLQQPDDVQVSTNGVVLSTVAPFREDAYNLLVLSKNTKGLKPKQIVPYYKAKSDPYFKNLAIWEQAVKYLMMHKVIEQKKDGNKQLGTYLISGTIEEAVESMRPTTPYLSGGQ